MKVKAGSRLSAGIVVAIEERTARLTILIDPRKKSVFERLCAEEDATPSQVVRRLIRRYIEERTGRRWVPPAAESSRRLPAGTRRKSARRRADAAHGK
jgi:Ribbon-helix-helix protein